MNGNSTKVILVRHGQTEWNRVERFRGRADIALNSTGRRQAKAVARRLANLGDVAMVYSSPLLRCLDTATPIAVAAGAEMRPLPGIIDIDYGEWQGLSPAEAEERYPDIFPAWQEAPHAVPIPGGESLAAVRERAVSALEGVVQLYSGQTIVLVTHKVICKVLVCHALELDNCHFWRMEQDNGAVNIFVRLAGGYLIKCVNDTCHLR